MSDDEVIKAISRQCVPVAINREWISKEKSPVGDFYRTIQKQRPTQYQGIYVIDPDGKVLANQAKEPADVKDWPADLREVIKAGVKEYGKVTRRPAMKYNALPDRGEGIRADGSIVVAVYTRSMTPDLDRQNFGDPTHDSVVLTASYVATLGRPSAKVGKTWEVSTRAVECLHKVLSPSSDSNTMPRANEVTHARLFCKVERVRQGIAYLSYTGRIAGSHVWEFPPNKGKKMSADMMLAGVGTCDAKTGKLLSITLVGDGIYRDIPPYDQKSGYGAVVEWKGRR